MIPFCNGNVWGIADSIIIRQKIIGVWSRHIVHSWWQKWTRHWFMVVSPGSMFLVVHCRVTRPDAVFLRLPSSLCKKAYIIISTYWIELDKNQILLSWNLAILQLIKAHKSQERQLIPYASLHSAQSSLHALLNFHRTQDKSDIGSAKKLVRYQISIITYVPVSNV